MKKTITKIDKTLFVVMVLLCIIGLLMVFSSSYMTAILRYNKPSTYFFIRQLVFFALAYIVGFIILHIKTSSYKAFCLPLMVAVIAALLFLLAYGTFTNNVQSWIYIGSFAIQPSEFAKSVLIMCMACYYDGLVKKKKKNMWWYIIPLIIVLFVVGFIMAQPDFGSAMIVLALAFCIFISLPMPKSNLPKIILLLAVGGIIAVFALLYSGTEILNSSQMERLNFQNPCQRYQEDTGYQVCNGFIAINNGGLTGVGFGNSTQKYLYLPEAHTDFIFAILVEEGGLISAVIVLILYIILLYRLLVIAKEAHNLRGSILAYGTFWMFALHIIVNLTGMLAILPLTGVPFPLMSYGGSSTLNFVIMLFVSQRVAIENKEYKERETIKKLTKY